MTAVNQANWNQVKLGEVCTLIKRGIAPMYIESGGIRVINQKCIRDHEIDYSLARRNDPEIKRVPEERLIQVGDVLINSTGTGTLGRVAQVRKQPSEPTTVDTHVTIVRPAPEKFFLDFFGYMMIAIEDELISGGHGASGQTELPRTDLEKKFTVSFPSSREEQQRIVAVLDEAFEGLTRARAHAEANLQSARELFASELDSACKAHAKEYGTISLAEISEDITDGDHMPPPKAQDGIPFVTIKNIDKETHDIDFSDTFKVPENYYNELKDKRKPRVGDVLYTVTGSFGIPVLVQGDQRFCFQRHIGLIRPRSDISPEWLYFVLASPFVFEQADAGATGTAQRTVSLKLLRSMVVPSVPSELQTAMADRFRGIYSEASRLALNYQAKVYDLDDLRRSLLQKAFAGELT